MVKARLIELVIDYDQRHDIFYLLSLLPDKSICKKYEIEAYTLTHYAVVTRCGYTNPTENEMYDAFEIAERIISAL